MRPLLWLLQLLLVSFGSRDILGDQVPTDSTTVIPIPAPAASKADENSAHIDSIKPKMEDQTASALLVHSAVDGTTNSPVPFIDIESADPIPLTNKKRASDIGTMAADGESANKVEPKQATTDSKQKENIELIDKALSRQEDSSTTPEPDSTSAKPTGLKKRQYQMDSSESTEYLPVGVVDGNGDASANAYFTSDPRRRVTLSHDEFSQMLSQVLKQNQVYSNVQQDPLQSIPPYLRPQVEKLADSGDKDSELYLDDGRQQGFQLQDQRNNNGPIYISVPINKDYKQSKPRPQQQLQIFHNTDLVLTPTTKRPPIDPPTEVIQQQQTHLDLTVNPVLPTGPPPPSVPSKPIVLAPPPVDPVLPAGPPPPSVPTKAIVLAPPPVNPVLPAGPPPPSVLTNAIVLAPPPVKPVLPDNPSIPSPPPFDLIIQVKPPVHPTNPPTSKPPPVNPVVHIYGPPPPNNAVPKPPSPNTVVHISVTNLSSSANVTVPPSCPTLLEFLNASRNVWQGIAQAGGLQAGLGVFFQAAGKVITTLTQCAKAILAEIGALFYQGVVEKMLGQLDAVPNVASINTANIKTTDGRRQIDSKNQTKRNSPTANNKKGRRYKKHVNAGAAGSSVNGDFIEAEIEEMDLEAEDEVTQDPGTVRGRKEAELKEQEPAKESLQDNEESLLKVDNVEPGMY